MDYGFGIDIGGTAVKLGLFTQDGALVEKWEIPTRTEEGGAYILPDIAQAVTGCLHRRGIAQCLGIGLGVPGPVSPSGVVNRCVNLGWGVFNIHEVLGKATGPPVSAALAAHVAALGECWAGGGQGWENLVLVTLGTGIGGGVVLGGRILYGAHGAAGEIGHLPSNPAETEVCGCGKTGCAEQYGSATGILRLARRYLAETDTPSALRAMDNYSCKDIFTLTQDPGAGAIREQYFDFLGRFLAQVCCVVDPEAVVLGGGVSKAGQALLDGVQAAYRRYAFHASRDTKFALATLGADAGIYGGMKLVLDEFGGTKR